MKKSRWVLLILGVLILVCALVFFNDKGEDDETFVKGQEAEYVDWCYVAEPQYKVLTSLSCIEFENSELYFYLSKDETLRYFYIECKDELKWKENGTFDLEKTIDSDIPLTVSSKGKTVTAYILSEGKETPEGYIGNSVSFELKGNEYNLTLCAKEE